MPPPLVLASASPRRAEMLRGMGVEFETIAPAVAEAEGGFLAPVEVALTNAARKALRVSEKRRQALVLGADTVVALDGRIFGKPATRKAAAKMLAALSGRTHEVITGVCLARAHFNELTLFAERTLVAFRRLTPRAIAAYLDAVDVLDKAGAYAIQERGDALVRRVEGSFSNVVGLPAERVSEALQAHGFRITRRARS